MRGKKEERKEGKSWDRKRKDGKRAGFEGRDLGRQDWSNSSSGGQHSKLSSDMLACLLADAGGARMPEESEPVCH